MKHRRLRGILRPLRRTPFHPQWMVFRRRHDTAAELAPQLAGRVLDVGCAEQAVRHGLPPGVAYVGLDYPPTASFWYRTRPQLFADGQRLPFAGGSFDWVLLLDVLEHLPRPRQCLSEAHRVLAAGGRAAVQVPFLYPLHDAPLDFRRWTAFGLRALAEECGFAVVRERAQGRPAETAALLTNLAASLAVAGWIERRSPLAAAALLLPPAVLVTNLGGWLLGALGGDDPAMPHGYQLILVKR